MSVAELYRRLGPVPASADSLATGATPMLVDDLLLLAKASRPDFLQPETIDLEDLTRERSRLSRSGRPADRRVRLRQARCSPGPPLSRTRSARRD